MMRRLLLLPLLLVLCAAGLSAAAEPAPPLRVAVLIPYAQDALARVKGPFEMVAAVRSQMHVPVAGGAIDLGNPHSPSYERLVDARAQLVVGDAALHAAQSKKLDVGGAEVMLLDGSSVALTLAGVRHNGP